MFNSKGNSYVYGFINRVLITCLLTIFCLIFFKKNSSFKHSFYDRFLSQNFNFAHINNIYKKYFGSAIPFSEYLSNSQAVFNERIVYDSYEPFLDGVALSVGSDYLIPAINSGLVVFIGEKDGYGNTVIVQQTDGVDVWYSNLNDYGVKLYEYVNAGSVIGGCNQKLFLVFKKDGNVLDFKKYI